jgi:hypothetical protein
MNHAPGWDQGFGLGLDKILALETLEQLELERDA